MWRSESLYLPQQFDLYLEMFLQGEQVKQTWNQSGILDLLSSRRVCDNIATKFYPFNAISPKTCRLVY